MNTLIESVIDNMEKQLVGYQYLLTYRYHNLCVKAEPMALLSVIVRMNGEEQEIEQVADVVVPDDYHFQILPKITNSLEEINMGILTVHPEFEPSFKQMDPENPDSQYLMYKMPVVNKERRDILMETSKVLHDECKVRIEEVCADEIADFGELFVSNPQNFNEASQAIDKLRKEYLENIDQLMEKKQDEIEDAYMHYAEGTPAPQAEPEGEDYFIDGIRMGAEEE